MFIVLGSNPINNSACLHEVFLAEQHVGLLMSRVCTDVDQFQKGMGPLQKSRHWKLDENVSWHAVIVTSSKVLYQMKLLRKI